MSTRYVRPLVRAHASDSANAREHPRSDRIALRTAASLVTRFVSLSSLLSSLSSLVSLSNRIALERRYAPTHRARRVSASVRVETKHLCGAMTLS